MALTNTCVRFLVWAKKQGVSFDNTLTLGHLDNLATRETLSELTTKEAGLIDLEKINWTEKYADSIFSAMGAKEVLSLDNSDYEKASLVYDLNAPLPASFKEKFSVIVDGGTLEHVFNFPQAIKSCMQSLKNGGHFIGFSPANNLMGHGFYQFSPELMYRLFSGTNGFKIKGIFLVAADFSVDATTWYEVTDPASLKDRVELTNTSSTYMMVLAEKIHSTELSSPIYQSDYTQAWEKKDMPAETSPGNKPPILQRIVNRLFKKQKTEEDLEKINPLFFKKRNVE